ncbi:MAG: nuclear transport factor 2 family protein [Deltaproteobacteria bacterium]
MLSQQEISDRFEIHDLLYRYADIIDHKEFAKLRDEVFTEDAFIDYSAFGGSTGDPETTIEFLAKVLTVQLFPTTQHLVANMQVVLDGDSATGRIMCLNPQNMQIGEETRVFFCGLWYLDEYRRTPAGWRILRRVEEKSWVHNTPDFMNL